VFRKKLFNLKRYYEQLAEVTSSIERSENEIIDKKALRYFHMLTARCERLFHGVLNLRDYVTQVREAYQAQMDIGLNKVMKLFTVITAVFLPLTLITGWYGMNIPMPEFRWAYAYPFRDRAQHCGRRREHYPDPEE
jgi:magnesium transporter